MSNSFIGEIRTFGFNFAPRGTMMCNGQTLTVNQYTALYALIGTYYGGNGSTTFNLPDLRSRVPLHMGQGPGLSVYTIGQRAGTETVTLNSAQLPAHTHAVTGTLSASTSKGSLQTPTSGAMLSRAVDQNGADVPQIYVPAGTGTTVPLSGVSGTTSVAGGNQPFSIIQPYLALNFCIQVQGLYPSRN